MQQEKNLLKHAMKNENTIKKYSRTEKIVQQLNKIIENKGKSKKRIKFIR